MTNEIEKVVSEFDTYVQASGHKNKDAIWLLFQHFIDSVESIYPIRPDGAVEYNYPIEPDALLYLKDCLVRVRDGEDARKVFPSCNDEGRKKSKDGLEIARAVVAMLRDKEAETLNEAFEKVGEKLNKSHGAIRSHYIKHQKVAEALECFSVKAKRGRPPKNSTKLG